MHSLPMEAMEKLSEKHHNTAHSRILDAAEKEFGRMGYSGASMKSISQGADVAQGLLHYHFGNKDNLFEAVIARRAAKISMARETLLSQIDLMSPDAVEMIFDALHRPAFEDENSPEAYSIIFSGKYVGKRDEAYLVNKYYDATATKFIDAILIAEPSASREIAAWAYTMAIGTMITTIGQDGRQEQLAGLPQRTQTPSVDAIVRPLALFSAGGLMRMIATMTIEKD